MRTGGNETQFFDGRLSSSKARNVPPKESFEGQAINRGDKTNKMMLTCGVSNINFIRLEKKNSLES